MRTIQPAEDHGHKGRLAALRAEMAGSSTQEALHGVWSFGDAALDRCLPPRALARGRLHEIVFAAANDQAAATGFAAALVLRFTRNAGQETVFWCQRQHDRREAGRLYGPGLTAFGYDPGRVIHVCVRRDIDVLWVMEEAIASGAVPVVIGEGARIDLTASRRLSLAAEKSGVTAFFVRPLAGSISNAAWTRWQVAPAPSAPDPLDMRAPGPPRFHLHLLRSRAGFNADQGFARSWIVEWNHETHCFAMAAPLADRAAQAAPARPAPALSLVSARLPERRAG